MNDSDSQKFDCAVMNCIGVYTVILLIVTIALCVFIILAMLRNNELLTKRIAEKIADKKTKSY